MKKSETEKMAEREISKYISLCKTYPKATFNDVVVIVEGNRDAYLPRRSFYSFTGYPEYGAVTIEFITSATASFSRWKQDVTLALTPEDFWRLKAWEDGNIEGMKSESLRRDKEHFLELLEHCREKKQERVWGGK